MFRQILLQAAVSVLQNLLKSGTFSQLLTQLLGGLANNPAAAQQMSSGLPSSPPELILDGETLKIKHADGQVHSVDLSGV